MVKYLIMDVDGTLTDGKIYMGPAGEAMKAFSVKDGYVINFILKLANIVPVIITARTSPIVQQRCDELGIKEVYQGKMDKLATLMEIVDDGNLSLCAYFGDDIIDMKCMVPIKQAGGIVGCPSDAIQEVKAIADYVCINKAGEGALREFAEWLLNPKPDSAEVKQRIDYAIEYLKNLTMCEEDVGKKQIVDSNFSYLIQSYQTKPEEECKLESHRKYVEIQLMINGEEVIDISDISRLTIKDEYNYENDVMYWDIPQRMVRTSLSTGDYIVLYPEHAHRGRTSGNASQSVLKIEGKVRVNFE